MFSIIRFIRGYLLLSLSGYAPERFINLCNYNGIKIWQVAPIKEGYQFYIYKSDLFQIKNFQKKTGTKVVISQRLGLPFILQKYKKRQFFLLGLMICFSILYLTTRNVWSFQISGNRTFTKDQYMNFLSENKIYYGTPKKKIDTEQLNKYLRQNYDYITWASFQIKGTTLVLQLKEEYKKNNIYTYTDEYGHMYANHNGTIKEIITRSGTPLCKIGDNVEKGNLIISGDITILNDDETVKETKHIKADGDIVIDYPLSYTDKQPYYVSEKVYTGKTKTIFFIIIGNKMIKLYDKYPYSHNDLMNETYSFQLRYLSDLRLTLGCTKCMEYTMSSKLLNRDSAIKYIDDRFYEFCKTLNQKGIQIIGKNVKMNYTSNQLEVLVNMIVEQSGGIYIPAN